MEDEKSLTSFGALREKLIALGIKIIEPSGKNGYREVTSKDVTLGDIRNGRLKIDPTGIFKSTQIQAKNNVYFCTNANTT